MVRMLWLQAGISEQQSRFNSSHHWGGAGIGACVDLSPTYDSVPGFLMPGTGKGDIS